MSEYTQQLLSVTDLGKMLGAKGSTLRGYLIRMGVKPAYAYSGRLSVYSLTPPEYEELRRRVEYLRRRPAGTSPRRQGGKANPEQASLGLPEGLNPEKALPDPNIAYIASEVRRIGGLVDRLMSVWGLTSAAPDATPEGDKSGQVGH